MKALDTMPTTRSPTASRNRPRNRPDDGHACLSVVMPCFNEVDVVATSIARVLDSPFTGELIVVNDGSTDGTREVIASIDDPRITVIDQPQNRGKGAALRVGFQAARLPYVIVQDADCEYDPADYADVLEPLLLGKADVVYGSRFHTSRPHRVLYFWHSLGNRGLTTLSNMLTDLNLTDMETGSKAFRREVLRTFEIEEDRFGCEPEITAKVARGHWRIYEVGVSYAGRTYAEGKKIGWRDGVHALRCIVKYSSIAVGPHRHWSPSRVPGLGHGHGSWGGMTVEERERERRRRWPRRVA